jgi:hypothetical protein
VGDERKPVLADVHLDGTPVEKREEVGDEAFRPPGAQPAAELEVAATPAPVRRVEPVGEVAQRVAPSEPLPERSVARAAGEGIAAFLLALPASFLPARWRRGAIAQLPLPTATTVSGVLEAIGALIAGGWLFERYRHAVADQAMATIGRAMADGRMQPGHEGHVIGALPTMGATLLIAFMLSPAGLACLWFFGEGLVRLGAGLASEAVGTMPLALLAVAIDLVRKPRRSEFDRYDAHDQFQEDARVVQMRERLRSWRLRAEPPPVVPDEVRKNDVTGEVRIYTSHDFGWKPRNTIQVDGEIYELAGEGPAPPPHVREYALRPMPAGAAIRNLAVYR